MKDEGIISTILLSWKIVCIHSLNLLMNRQHFRMHGLGEDIVNTYVGLLDLVCSIQYTVYNNTCMYIYYTNNVLFIFIKVQVNCVTFGTKHNTNTWIYST